MENTIWCQSCGMPMARPEEFGTNGDDTPNNDYCVYCYKGGEFTQGLSMDEMIEHNLAYLDEFNKDSAEQFTKDQAREHMKELFPKLKRWKK